MRGSSNFGQQWLSLACGGTRTHGWDEAVQGQGFFTLISQKIHLVWRLLGLPDYHIIPGLHILWLSTSGLSLLCLAQSSLKIAVFKLLREKALIQNLLLSPTVITRPRNVKTNLGSCFFWILGFQLSWVGGRPVPLRGTSSAWLGWELCLPQLNSLITLIPTVISWVWVVLGAAPPILHLLMEGEVGLDFFCFVLFWYSGFEFLTWDLCPAALKL